MSRLLPLLLLMVFALTGCEELPSDQQGSSKAERSTPSQQTTPKRSQTKKRSAKKPRKKAKAAKKKAPAPKRWKQTKNKVGTAAWMLERVPHRAETTSDTYRREYFGGWNYRSGCTTRQHVLIRQSKQGRRVGCTVVSGSWTSAYDGVKTRNPSSFDIDHLVPLREAWRSGASRWNVPTRERYANDLGYAATLRAVTANSNRVKGDRDPAQWMPPRQIHHCKYIGSWIAVKYRWKLSADPAERRVLARYVKSCGRKADVQVPRRGVVRISKHPVGSRKPAKKRSFSGTTKPRSSKGKLDRRHKTCKEAIRPGLGPYRRGVDPEYNWYRDADRDGLVCER